MGQRSALVEHVQLLSVKQQNHAARTQSMNTPGVLLNMKDEDQSAQLDDNLTLAPTLTAPGLPSSGKTKVARSMGTHAWLMLRA